MLILINLILNIIWFTLIPECYSVSDNWRLVGQCVNPRLSFKQRTLVKKYQFTQSMTFYFFSPSDTYRINKIHVQPIAQLLYTRCDLVEMDLLFAAI